MKTLQKSSVLLASAALLATTSLSGVNTGVVGYTSTTLPAGVGNIFAPSFVNSDSFAGTATGVTPGATSTITVSGTLVANAFDESVSVASVSKGYPLYYVEVLNDTNGADGLDTEGLILDVVSNTAGAVVVGVDTSTLGVQGDEAIAIRKHLTLGDVFAGSTGLLGFTDAITIYNEDGAGTAVSHLPDGAGGFVLGADFVTVTTDAPILPGTGFVINNIGAVTVIPSGVVKETDTQVTVNGGSVVNIISALKPLTSINLAADGRLNAALAPFTDAGNQYTTDGSLGPVSYAGLGAGFLDDGSGGFVSAVDFFTPVTVSIDGTSEGIVVNAAAGTVYKTTGTVIP